MKRLVILCLGTAVMLAVAASAFANTQANARVALHIQGHAAKSGTECTTAAPTTVPCSQFVTEVDITTTKGYDVYIIVANAASGPGVAGLALGLAYDQAQGFVNTAGSGVDIFGWALCADLEFASGTWPNSRSSNSITFQQTPTPNCQRTVITGFESEGVHVILGALYVYAYGADRMGVIPRPDVPVPDLALSDCSLVTTELKGKGQSGIVSFYEGSLIQGCNPCLAADVFCEPIPVQNVSWGKIKSQY